MKENTPNYPDLSVSRDSLLRLIHITDNENTSLIYFTKCLIYAKFHLFNTSVLLRGGGKWSMIKDEDVENGLFAGYTGELLINIYNKKLWEALK